jgi:hypothetical protein
MKKTLPSDHDISEKKSLFSQSVQVTLSQNRKNVKVTVRDKLRLVNDELIRFKESGISYKIICSLLADKLNLYVSEQTLREHCQQELGFGKRVTGIGTGNKTAARPAQVTQQAERTLTNQAPVGIEATVQKATTKEIELITKINKQMTTEQVYSQPTQQIAAKISGQIAEQTEKLINQLEDY